MKKRLLGIGMVMFGSGMYLKGLKAAAAMTEEFDGINVHAIEYDQTLETLNNRVMREGLLHVGNCKTYNYGGIKVCLTVDQLITLERQWEAWRIWYRDDAYAWNHRPSNEVYGSAWESLNFRQREAVSEDLYNTFVDHINDGSYKWDGKKWQTGSLAAW